MTLEDLDELRNKIFKCNECFLNKGCHHHQDIAGGYGDQKLAVITINPTGKECKTKPCSLLEEIEKDPNFETLKRYSDEFMEAVIQYLGGDEKNISTSCSELHKAHINFPWWCNFKEKFGIENENNLRKIAVLDMVKYASPTQREVKKFFKTCSEKWLEKQLRYLPNLTGIILAGGKPQKKFAMLFKKKIHSFEKSKNVLHGVKRCTVELGDRDPIDILMTYAISGHTNGKWNAGNSEKEEIQNWIREKLNKTNISDVLSEC